jgi:glutamate--cysteine ligase
MSSDHAGAAGRPVSREDLLEYFFESCLDRRNSDGLRIGVEWELLPITPATGRAHPFTGDADGVGKAFLSLRDQGFSAPMGSHAPTTLQRGKLALNLEPGGQTEISGSPHLKLQQVAAELADCSRILGKAARTHGFAFVSHGLQPVSQANEIQMVPKRRYQILAEFLAKAGGTQYRDMMTRTASLQVSLDYRNEADAGRKLRFALLAGPIAAAIFANSPLEHGKPNGLASGRSQVWVHTAPSRTGLMREILSGGWSFEKYVDYALSLPTILVRADDGGVAPANGVPFGELLARGVDGRPIMMADWELHLSTLFHDARLKRVMEVRSCDAPPPDRAMTISALWTGLLYHEPSLERGLKLLEPIYPVWDQIRDAVIQHGLRARVGAIDVRTLAAELYTLAEAGLAARNFAEEQYLKPLAHLIDTARTFADETLEAYAKGGLDHFVNGARIDRE